MDLTTEARRAARIAPGRYDAARLGPAHLQPGRRPVAVWSPHPLQPARDRVLVREPIARGESLADYLERVGLAAAIGRRPVLLTLDGAEVPRDLWAYVRPKPGVLINIVATVAGGGGGGKNPIATLFSLGLAVFNPGAAVAQYFGLEGFAAKLAGFAFNGALGLAANALFAPPPPRLALAQGQSGGAESPTYSLSGGSNRARPYEPMPMIAGTHRIFFDLGARTYTEFVDDDQYLYQVFEAGYNTLTLGDYKIGATPLSTYTDVTLEESGTDGALTLFPANVDVSEGANLSNQSATLAVRTSSPNATAIAIDITGTLYQIDTATGAVAAATRIYELVYRAVGSSTWLPLVDAGAEVTISHASRRPLRRTFRRDVALGQYEVGARKVSADVSLATVSEEVFWSQLRTYQPDTADYTGRRRIALRVKATGQLNGTVQQFSAIARARCLAWNGAAWVEAETSNPAWWFRAIALGRTVTIDGRAVRVWGAGLDAARVDDASIKAWGAWCASKRLTFNAIFDRAISAQEMLEAVATAGRASPTWAEGRLGVAYDQGGQPVTAVFGMSNILAGSFSVSYQTEQLADEVVGNFISPNLDWQRDTVRCVVPGTVTPTRSRQVDLFGMTSLDMAARACNLYAAQNLYRLRRYKWQSDFEAMPASRGDVVQLAHDLASYDYSGRLVEGSTAAVLKLERSVPLVTGGAWVTLVEPDGTFATHAVAGGSGNSDTLTLVVPLGFNPAADPDHPVFDYRWLYGSSGTPGRKVKIDSIAPLSESVVEVTAIDEVDAYYAAEDNPYAYTPPRPLFGALAISNLQVIEEGIRAAQGYLVQLTVAWDAINDYAGAEVFAAINGGPEISRGQTAGRSISFTVEDGDTVALRLVASSSLKTLGGLVTLTTTHVVAFAQSTPPANVASFTIDGNTLAWAPVGDVDLVGYRIRFNYGQNADWSSATPLHEGTITENPWPMPRRPAGSITLMIKAVDSAGIESENAAVIYTDLGASSTAKILEVIDLDALGYPGTIAGGTVSGGDVVANSTTLFWRADDAAFWGDDAAAFWPASVYAALTYTATVTPTRAGAGNATLTLSSTIAGDPYSIEYRLQSPAAFWADSDGALFWGDDAAPFWLASPDFVAFPGSLAVTNAPLDLQISIGGGAVQGVISTLAARIDVPYLTEYLNDVPIAAVSGSRLPITGTYTGIDNVQITVQFDGHGAVGAALVDKDPALGPLVKALDDNGAAVAGLVDVFIQGYRG